MCLCYIEPTIQTLGIIMLCNEQCAEVARPLCTSKLCLALAEGRLPHHQSSVSCDMHDIVRTSPHRAGVICNRQHPRLSGAVHLV